MSTLDGQDGTDYGNGPDALDVARDATVDKAIRHGEELVHSAEELKCQLFPSGTASFHVWKVGAVDGDRCKCGSRVLGKGLTTEQEELDQIKAVLSWASQNVMSIWHHGYGEWQVQGKSFNLFRPILYQALLSAYQQSKGEK